MINILEKLVPRQDLLGRTVPAFIVMVVFYILVLLISLCLSVLVSRYCPVLIGKKNDAK